MRVAVLGVAHVHADQLLEISKTKTQFDIVGIWDHKSERASNFSKKYNVPYVENLEKLLGLNLDGVFVFSENIYHKELCEKSIPYVKNILCEKPLATTGDDAISIINACKKQGVNLKVAFNNRFTQPALQARQIIQSGKIGEVLGITATNHGSNPGGWFVDEKLSGGGALIDHTVHLVDLVYFLTNLKPKSVTAEMSTIFNDIPCEDCGSMLIELDREIPFSIDFSWSRPKGYPVDGDNKLEILGTKGTCLINNRGECLDQSIDGTYSVQSYSKNAYDMMLDDFARSIEGKYSWGSSNEECLIHVQVVEAAYCSIKTGKPVKI